MQRCPVIKFRTALPEVPTPAEQGPAMAPSPYPFGLRNAAATFASAYASAHTEPSGRHQRFALDLFATTSAHTHTDSSEEDKAWTGADFFGLRDPQAMRLFLATSDYCFGYSDSDDEGTYDPTRECFHIGLGMPGASNESEGAANHSPLGQGVGNATPPLVEPWAARNENAAPEELRRLDLEQLRELQAKVDQDRLLLQ